MKQRNAIQATENTEFTEKKPPITDVIFFAGQVNGPITINLLLSVFSVSPERAALLPLSVGTLLAGVNSVAKAFLPAIKSLLLVLALLLPLSAWCEEAKPVADDPVLEQRMIRLSEDLRCLVCQNESLAGSRADLAQDLRREIRDLMRAGKSDEEVIAYLTQRYGDFVLYKPPVKPVTWLLWFGPFVLLVGAVGGLLVYLKRRSRRVEAETFSEEERQRVEALLNNGKQS